jgi:hypothetical protein
MSLLDDAQGFLWKRALAYQRLFLGHGTDTDTVLQDLAKFCRASETTFNPDPRLSDVLIGRREVFIRISQHLNLTHEQLWDLYGNKSLKSLEPEPEE